MGPETATRAPEQRQDVHQIFESRKGADFGAFQSDAKLVICASD